MAPRDAASSPSSSSSTGDSHVARARAPFSRQTRSNARAQRRTPQRTTTTATAAAVRGNEQRRAASERASRALSGGGERGEGMRHASPESSGAVAAVRVACAAQEPTRCAPADAERRRACVAEPATATRAAQAHGASPTAETERPRGAGAPRAAGSPCRRASGGRRRASRLSGGQPGAAHGEGALVRGRRQPPAGETLAQRSRVARAGGPAAPAHAGAGWMRARPRRRRARRQSPCCCRTRPPSARTCQWSSFCAWQ